ncbi:hypothetical protein Scep_019805 [Stephania cephalantha]|uniref:Uncharacterized protein n=1 Tax=Stephania cephalantha TaxID=152367 RepID=A0AAP0NQ68_9MAGN
MRTISLILRVLKASNHHEDGSKELPCIPSYIMGQASSEVKSLNPMKAASKKREAPAGEKPEPVRTHLRNMIIVPEIDWEHHWCLQWQDLQPGRDQGVVYRNSGFLKNIDSLSPLKTPLILSPEAAAAAADTKNKPRRRRAGLVAVFRTDEELVLQYKGASFDDVVDGDEALESDGGVAGGVEAVHQGVDAEGGGGAGGEAVGEDGGDVVLVRGEEIVETEERTMEASRRRGWCGGGILFG